MSGHESMVVTFRQEDWRWSNFCGLQLQDDLQSNLSSTNHSPGICTLAEIVSRGLPAPSPALTGPYTQPNKLVSMSGPPSLPSHLTHLEEDTRCVPKPDQHS